MIFDLVTKILFANFLKKIHGSSGPRELSRDFLSTGGKRKYAIFEVIRAYLRGISEVFFGSKILTSFAVDQEKFGHKCALGP